MRGLDLKYSTVAGLVIEHALLEATDSDAAARAYREAYLVATQLLHQAHLRRRSDETTIARLRAELAAANRRAA